MKNKFKKIITLLICMTLISGFNISSVSADWDPNAERTMQLVDELNGSIGDFKSNTFYIQAKNDYSNIIRFARICIEGLSVNENANGTGSFNATISDATTGSNHAIRFDRMTTDGNFNNADDDNCFTYSRTSGNKLVVPVNGDIPIIKGTFVNHNTNTITFNLTSDSLFDAENTGIESINTVDYIISENDIPEFSEVYIKTTNTNTTNDFEGNYNNMTLWYEYDFANNTATINSDIADGSLNVLLSAKKAYLWFIIKDDTDINSTLAGTATDSEGNIKNFARSGSKTGFGESIDVLNFATEYNVNLKAYDDQMNTGNATELTGLNFVTQADNEKPAPVTNVVMTSEYNYMNTHGGVIDFSATSDNSNVINNYYLMEKQKLELAGYLTDGVINSINLRPNVNDFAIKTCAADCTMVFTEDEMLGKVTNENDIHNNVFVVIAEDDAHTLNNIGDATNFSDIGSTTVADREGDFTDDGKNNLADITKLLRSRFGLERLYPEE